MRRPDLAAVPCPTATADGAALCSRRRATEQWSTEGARVEGLLSTSEVREEIGNENRLTDGLSTVVLLAAPKHFKKATTTRMYTTSTGGSVCLECGGGVGSDALVCSSDIRQALDGVKVSLHLWGRRHVHSDVAAPRQHNVEVRVRDGERVAGQKLGLVEDRLEVGELLGEIFLALVLDLRGIAGVEQGSKVGVDLACDVVQCGNHLVALAGSQSGEDGRATGLVTDPRKGRGALVEHSAVIEHDGRHIPLGVDLVKIGPRSSLVCSEIHSLALERQAGGERSNEGGSAAAGGSVVELGHLRGVGKGTC